jgi:hypothetical protein
MQEDAVEMFLPWTNKKKVSQYHRKELEPIHIVQKEDEKNEEIIKDTVHIEPPYDENTPCINFDEEIIVLMWDKRKGKPRYE